MQWLASQLKRLLTVTAAQDVNTYRRKPVLIILFGSTFGAVALSTVALCISYMTGYYPLVFNRLAGLIVVLLFLIFLYSLLRRGYYILVANGILGIYVILATVMAVQWSIDLPIVLLLFCVVIVLSGMIIGAKYALGVMLVSMVILFTVEYETARNVLHPNTTWRQTAIGIPDLFPYFLVFLLLGVSSWLFNRQTDMALRRARKADLALLEEKKMLEIKVEERTRELQAAQMDKMQQLYRFAQLGQFSTSILHDLANHLTTMGLDIEGSLEERDENSRLQARVGRRIRYIEGMIRWAYDHINGKVQERRFSVRHEIKEAISILRYDAGHRHVQLKNTTKATGPLSLYGDPNRFRQIVANLVSNAIDAYETLPDDEQYVVEIETQRTGDGSIGITVHDSGVGIPEGSQKKIFQPFYSTKYEGMGIGLFVVRQIIEEYFGGRIELTSEKGNTTFHVTIPERKQVEREKQDN